MKEPRKYRLVCFSHDPFEIGDHNCPACQWDLARGLSPPLEVSEKERKFLFKVRKLFEEYEGPRSEHYHGVGSK